MKSALDIVIDNRAARDAETPTENAPEAKPEQSLQSKIENAAMVANRYGTPMDEAQAAMGMTEQQIEDFRRN